MTRERVWASAEYAGHVLQQNEFPDREALISELSFISDSLDYEDCVVLVIDENAGYISSDGEESCMEEPDVLLRALEGRFSDIDSVPHRGEDSSYMIFYLPISPKNLPGLSGKAVLTAVCVNSVELTDKLNVAAFGEEAQTVIVRRDGSKIFHSNGENQILSGSNVYNELKTKEFVNGRLDEFIAAVNKNQPLVCEFLGDDGRNYFLSCASTLENDWLVLELVPTEALSTGMSAYMSRTIRYMALVFSLFTAFIIVLAVLMAMNRREKQAREKEYLQNAALREIAESEKAASLAKSEFLSNMSHDIRTPINGIMGMTAIALRSRDDPEKVEDCLRKIDGASSHLLSLVNDVLDMSRIERGKTEIARDPIHIGAVADNCASIIRGQLADRELEFVTEQQLEHPRVYGDELHLRQVLINILGNAVKFTPDGGTIRFLLRERPLDEDRSEYVFEIEDNGVGMKPEYLTKIFDAFSQEDGGSRTTYKGTGLGMAITKQLTELMGGDITVESEYEVGSRFTVTVPLELDDSPAEENVTDVTSDLSGYRFLLVEDNELNREIAADILEDAGAEVDTAENGEKAVEMFRANPPGTFDVILMDVMMPVMDGLEASRHIRALEREDAGNVPILAMTANAFEEDKRKVLEAGMNAHLSKPIQIDQLFRTISQLTVTR